MDVDIETEKNCTRQLPKNVELVWAEEKGVCSNGQKV
jgi:hypothetical protein